MTYVVIFVCLNGDFGQKSLCKAFKNVSVTSKPAPICVLQTSVVSYVFNLVFFSFVLLLIVWSLYFCVLHLFWGVWVKRY